MNVSRRRIRNASLPSFWTPRAAPSWRMTDSPASIECGALVTEATQRDLKLRIKAAERDGRIADAFRMMRELANLSGSD